MFQLNMVMTEKCNLACKYCVPGDTLIAMTDNTRKYIKDIEVNDEVLSIDAAAINNNRLFVKYAKAKVVKIFEPRYVKSLLRITAIDSYGNFRTLDVTHEHPLLKMNEMDVKSNSREWIKASDLNVKDKVQIIFFPLLGETAVNHLATISKIEEIPFDNYVYNIETTTHTYIANSFIVHNCYMNNTPSVMTPDIVDKTFEKLPQLLKTFNCIDANLIYFGGEPLLNFELIKYCHEKVKQSNLIKYDLIISNLLLLNDDIIDWIKKENVRISWSFDGLWNENNRVLVDGTSSLKLYKEKIDSIKRLTSACKIMISPQSLGTMVDNMHFMYDEMHIGTLDFSIVRDDIWNDNDIKRFENEIREFADEYIKYIRCGYDISIGLFSLPILDILVSKKYGKRPFGCFAGNSGIAVMPNGDLYPCARFGSNKCYKYGNIYNFDSKNIYTVNDAVNINPLAIEKCKMCKLYYYCNTGCTYSQLHNGKEPLDTICKLYHIIYRESLRIYNTLHKYDNTYDERIMKMIEGID